MALIMHFVISFFLLVLLFLVFSLLIIYANNLVKFV